MPQSHRRTCNICEANCGIIIEHEGSQVLSIKGDRDNTLSRGFICPKAVALQDVQDDPDRLRTPIKRRQDSWVEISWAQAFEEIGAKTRAILGADANATAVYVGNPNVHSYGNLMSVGHLNAALGKPQLYSASTVDQIPVQVASLRMYGHANLWGVPDIERTRTIVILGANPAASNGSLWTVPDFPNRVKDLQSRGGELIVIDPRRSETARIGNRHIFIRPASDIFLLIPLLKAVRRRKPHRPILPLAAGLDQVFAVLKNFDDHACAQACGVHVREIEDIADKLTSGPGALYGRMGVCVQEHGTLNAWLINLINICSGNFDRDGGIIFSMPAVDNLAMPTRTVGTKVSRVSGHRDALGEFPVAALAEEIETPGEGRIRALFVLAGNPTMSAPNGARLARAMQHLELMVSVDMYKTSTSRLAHYILPPVGPLEREHYGVVLLPSAIRNFAKFSPPMIEAAPGQKQDWEIIRELASAITGSPVQAPSPAAMLDSALKSGPYKISLAELAQHTSGKDFGPCQADTLPLRLRTEDGTIHCAPYEFLEALARIAKPTPTDADGRLFLISRRHIRSNNSWLANSHRLVKGPPRCTMLIHPDDAAARNLADGDLAQVRSGERHIVVASELSDEMMRGVISIPHGWGHDLPGVGLSVARSVPGASINDVTDDTRMDPLSGNAALSGVRVEVVRI